MGRARIGLIGLRTMGAAPASNIAEHGFDIAVFNRTTQVTRDFAASAGDLAPRIVPSETLEDFVAAIAKPRAILLLVPAGGPLDQQIAALTPLRDDDDLIVDCGNADFHDTIRREAATPLPFLGIGVSGGEEGARHGPAIMGGGAPEHWARIEDVMEAIAAKHEGAPCASEVLALLPRPPAAPPRRCAKSSRKRRCTAIPSRPCPPASRISTRRTRRAERRT